MYYFVNTISVDNINTTQIENLKEEFFSFMKKATHIVQGSFTDNETFKNACNYTRRIFKSSESINATNKPMEFRNKFIVGTNYLKSLVETNKAYVQGTGFLLPEFKECLHSFSVGLHKNNSIFKTINFSEEIKSTIHLNKNIANIIKSLPCDENIEANLFLKDQYQSIDLAIHLDNYIANFENLKLVTLEEVNLFLKKMNANLSVNSGDYFYNISFHDDKFKPFAHHIFAQTGDTVIIFTRDAQFYFAKLKIMLNNYHLADDTYVNLHTTLTDKTKIEVDKMNQCINTDAFKNVHKLNNFFAARNIRNVFCSSDGEKIVERILHYLNENPEVVLKKLHPNLSKDKINKIIEAHVI